MVIVAFSVLMALGLFILLNGIRKKDKTLNSFFMSIVWMVLSVILYSISFLGQFDNDFMRIGISYAAILFGILFVLTALTASAAKERTE
ncbi:hypothetical protein [Domibacillus epiphyticus]|uniref:Uncharacterized protein n=1 Tax=Domibacillus epiphyticus TaxID=1714355 RepID=A0A1V2AA70_9BACI|nr:hypothetical protein [Domibacillus epiphyticus]OMP67896.1 hypothetical protein BTO28_05255 [Domibacillus epiphyticus]